MSLFKSNAEKLAARLADLEDEARSLTKRAEDARAAEAEAQGKLVEDLGEGLPVDDWRKKRDAAEKKAADAERDLKAAQDAAEIVRGRLEEARLAESLEDLRRRYAEAEKRVPGAVAAFLEAGRTFSTALGRLEGLRSEAEGIRVQLRAAGEQARVIEIRLPEDLLSDELGHAEGRRRFPIDVPIWPTRTSS